VAPAGSGSGSTPRIDWHGPGCCEIEPGLTDAQFARIEPQSRFKFADDHRAFLAAGLPMNTPDQNPGWPLKPIQGVVLALLRRSGRCGHASQLPRRPADPPRASSSRSRER
jgi:hypothetical protein